MSLASHTSLCVCPPSPEPDPFRLVSSVSSSSFLVSYHAHVFKHSFDYISVDPRLQKAREREYERRLTEAPDKRERRLQYSKNMATLRRELETPEEREKRLGTSRVRAARRRWRGVYVYIYAVAAL